MMRRRLQTIALCAALVVAYGAVAFSAEPARFKVIVHPKNPITSIDRDTLRNAYLKKQASWSNGEAIRPIDLARTFPARDGFTRVVLKKTPAQLKTYWTQQIFSGKGVPPPEVQTTADLIAYVMANPGAVGYLPDDVDPRGAKVVEVK